ncbi:MAG: ATP-binding protein [Xenococcaceae cyanobacterium MO_207.B15]|nr:ATP-binding protein [Xenococcaceae cyanobacterium MO_207.B15]
MISNLSLYQIVQENGTPLPSVEISAITLRTCVKTVLELVREQQLTPTILVKTPQSQSWLEDIKQYQQTVPQARIYLCSDKPNYGSKAGSVALNSLIPIKLVKNSLLKRECFLTILSEAFSCLILAQWQTGKITVESSGKRLQQPYLQMVFSFEPSTIQVFLSGLKNAVPKATAERVADASIPEIDLISIAPGEPQLKSHLFTKQIQIIESLQKTLNQVTHKSANKETFSTTLGLQNNFLNNLVQELRSPITHMKTALSLLESKQLKKEQRQRYLKMLERECERQNSVVSGLLALLQLDNSVKSEIVYLEELVPGIVSTYQPLANEKQIQLGYTIPSHLPPVQCPRPWLRQMIVQLLNNSLQFTPAQGRVFVQASLKNEFVEIMISDTGIGIEPKEFNNIFDSFYRTRKVGNKPVVGAGLGLTIVQQLVQRCNGTISVNSKQGKGSTFTISLPVLPPELIDSLSEG